MTINADGSTAQLEKPTLWVGDAFERRSYADFLTNYLVSRTKPQNGQIRPFCMALDARWGEGKTFFVTKWAEQLNTSSAHPAFVFDAWAADYCQSDPIIAFIAAFKQAIEREIQRLPAGEQAIATAVDTMKKGISKIGKALFPAGKAILKGALNKVTAGAANEVIDAFKDGDFNSDEISTEIIGGKALEGVQEHAIPHKSSDISSS